MNRTIDPHIGSIMTIEQLYRECPPLLHVESKICHRIDQRSFISAYIPSNSVGAEVGVFTGLFSQRLLELTNPRVLFLVDPWWLKHGKMYPDWGRYTDHGRLPTEVAYRAAAIRTHTEKSESPALLDVSHSCDWLQRLPDNHLDWVYLDSSHEYADTVSELNLISKKLRPGGILLGDDWEIQPGSTGCGVFRAVSESVANRSFDLLFAGRELQWGLKCRH